MVTKPILLNETGEAMLAEMQEQNKLLRSIASGAYARPTDWDDIFSIVRQGKAQEVFAVGDLIVDQWTDKATGVTYEVPWQVGSFKNAILNDGTEVPAMYIQWHYASPFGVQFNNYQALYHCTEELPAGTYCFEIGTSWGDNLVAGNIYNFTLTKAVPAGGVLWFNGASIYESATSAWKIAALETPKDQEAQEVVLVSAGSAGTSLGTISSSNPSGKDIGNLQSVAFGYNRWSQSAIRQFLNSDKGIGEWWTPQNGLDVRPNELFTKHGFMSGMPDRLKANLRAVKVTTALNSVSDTGIEDDNLEDTYDKVFLLSLEEMYIANQLAGEGSAWEYWKRRLGTAAPVGWHPNIYQELIHYGVENHSAAQHVRLRSALRGYAFNTWLVYAGGYASDYHARYAHRFAPGCAIC